jgi:hypothetical protein
MKEMIIHDILKEEIEILVPNPPDLWPRIKEQAHIKKQSEVTPSVRANKQIAILAAVFLVVLIATLIWHPWETPVSAKQVLTEASNVWIAQLEGADYMYQRIRFIGSEIATMPSGAAEIWRSMDGQFIRFEMKNNQGELIYFFLQNEDGLWLSLHLDFLMNKSVETIYSTSIEEQKQFTKTNSQYNLFGLLELAKPNQDCFNLECFLGNISFGQLSGEPTIEKEYLNDSDVFSLEWVSQTGSLEDSEQTWDQVRTVKIDAQNYQLIQYTNPYWHVWNFLELRGMTSEDLPAGIFTSFPEGVQVLEDWQEKTILEMNGSDRLWIVSITPMEWETNTQSQRFILEVGYQLITRPEAIISARIDPSFNADDSNGYNGNIIELTDGDEIDISHGEGIVTLELNVVIREPWKGDTAPLMVSMYTHSLSDFGATMDNLSMLRTEIPISE